MASEPGSTEFEPTLRLHPLSWIFALAGSVRQLILPFIALLFFGARGDGGWFSMPLVFVFLGAMFVRALWHQWTFRYGFGPRGLVIREGLIFRNVRQIEYTRIENIDTERGVLHQVMNVAQVSVQTSTGGKPEALISVLDLPAVQEIRQRVFADTRPAATAQTEAVKASREEPLLHLPPMELVRHGLIDNRGLILVAAGAGVLHESGLFRWEDTDLDRWLGSSQVSDLADLGVAMQIGLASTAIVTALLIVRVLSVFLALVTLHDFTLSRQDGDLRVRYGLLTNVALTLRTRRIQAVHQTASPLHRLFGRVSLDVDLAGDSGGEQQQGNEGRKKTRWLAPVCPTAAAPALIAAALPVFDPTASPDWQALAPGARSRIFRRSALIVSLITAIPAWWYLREASMFVLPIVIALAWMHAHLYVKYTRWALERDVLLFRSGWLVRKLTIVPRDRVQSLNLSMSPFDRRQHMASLSVDTAGGSARAAGVRIRYLPVGVAHKLAATLYRSLSAGRA